MSTQYTIDEIKEGCAPLWNNVECMTCSRLLGYTDYLLSLVKDGSAEERDPADMLDAELTAAIRFHESEALRFRSESAKMWRFRLRTNNATDIDKQMLAELHARRATVPTETSARCGECAKCGHSGILKDGICIVQVPICSDDYHGTRPCGCKCSF